MVYRVYSEKKKGLNNEAEALLHELKNFLGVSSVTGVRLLNRYDVENIDKDLFEYCKTAVFSEPQQDNVYEEVSLDGDYVVGVEYLPGQFDQRADSAAQCIQLISQSDRPTVRTAKIYLFRGDFSAGEKEKIEKYLINPVESRKASLEKPETLAVEYALPETVETVAGFLDLDRPGLEKLIAARGFAMDLNDILFCQQYFAGEKRDPTITELKMIDTYWSDHCRHTTFLTTIDKISFEDSLLQEAYEEYLATREFLGVKKPVNLMDMATVGVKYLKKTGKLEKLDESDEINACTVKITVQTDRGPEDWLLLFKNETHNHPTEIEPFGGAATCIGGAIRDPLSGRSYVYAAMRVTGGANPLRPVDQTLPGKLPQKKIVTTAAAGYSSYGNQIGLATGQVDEIYHDGYAAKRMEIGAVVAAAPAENVRRQEPVPGDVVILLGGKTGRDGCGGATGSSKSHNLSSLENCGAEVQKGNAPEERKLQRLFRNKEASLLIKRCNDFGAGGVSVAIGELADGLMIDLDLVPKKYEGLDGTELAISESQERMAVVVEPKDVERFRALAAEENIEATVVATVSEEKRLVMKWKGNVIVDISREFLNSNGAEKHTEVILSAPQPFAKTVSGSFEEQYRNLAADLNVCSRRGLSERFDSTIGAGTVLMPFGGKYQQTPIQAMAHKISLEHGDTSTCSVMAWGYNPFITEKSPYHGAYLAVVESLCKLVASGASFTDVYLSFQEYFEKPMSDPRRWGKPAAAVLGAFKAQKDFGVASIGGKDSMSGSFENLDVPPTLVSFAVTTEDIDHILSPELKGAGHSVYLLKPEQNKDGLPDAESLKNVFARVSSLVQKKQALAVYTPGYGGIAEGVMKMCFGNGIGFRYADSLSEDIFGYCYGGFLVETETALSDALLLGTTTDIGRIEKDGKAVSLADLLSVYENKLESVYPCNIDQTVAETPNLAYAADQRHAPAIKAARPKAVIPVFPGTNCEYDTAKALEKAGAESEIVVIRNLTPQAVSESVDYFAKALEKANIVFIPGGFSGGDEPEGSGKFITAFFRNDSIRERVTDLLENRDGLMAGICNGFQALIKLGLVPYGKIVDTDETCPTLTFNVIGRHQSRLVRTRVASNKSPWLAATEPGEVYTVPISHGEGRFIASDELLAQLAGNGQIATQYADLSGNATGDIRFNPNGSFWAVEGITSPDGRVFGKMGHSERIGNGLYKNVDGQYDMGLFTSAVKYFQ